MRQQTFKFVKGRERKIRSDYIIDLEEILYLDSERQLTVCHLFKA